MSTNSLYIYHCGFFKIKAKNENINIFSLVLPVWDVISDIEYFNWVSADRLEFPRSTEVRGIIEIRHIARNIEVLNLR